jgi:UDP-N-acetylmuramate--alanine ligase
MSQWTLPPRGSRIFFAGLGGIGMSALAQLFRSQGYEVAGSDRDISSPAQAHLFSQLAQQGIQHFVQDGSGVTQFKPELIVYSTALEEDNPDFIAGQGVERLHRAAALSAAVAQSGLKPIAVAGSCGKTSVTAWIASALRALGKTPVMINGGYSPELESDSTPGNFGDGDDFIVFEADESDGSLVNFFPEVSLLLNIGDDHHSKDKLEIMFRTFLANGKENVCNQELSYLASENAKTFAKRDTDAELHSTAIRHSKQGAEFTLQDGLDVTIHQWGDHSVENALAVLAVLEACGFERQEAAQALSAFRGVRRRFEFKGLLNEALIYDDYAHNPQKIRACIEAARQVCNGAICVFFQPHGYGPLGFMRDCLLRELQACLTDEDQFVFLPVFYAGGTTSFKPSSDEVATQYAEAGLNCLSLAERDEAKEHLVKNNFKAALVVGARDPSLPAWGSSLTDVEK